MVWKLTPEKPKQQLHGMELPAAHRSLPPESTMSAHDILYGCIRGGPLGFLPQSGSGIRSDLSQSLGGKRTHGPVQMQGPGKYAAQRAGQTLGSAPLSLAPFLPPFHLAVFFSTSFSFLWRSGDVVCRISYLDIPEMPFDLVCGQFAPCESRILHMPTCTSTLTVLLELLQIHSFFL